MGKFDWFPEEFHPTASENVEYICVYRATKSIDVLSSDDFLPWIIEHPNKIKLFRPIVLKECEKGMFGVSLSTDLRSLKAKISKIVPLNKKIKSFSRGFTSLKRGISTKEDGNGHVDYYLYDYENNNPCEDFKIIEVRDDEK